MTVHEPTRRSTFIAPEVVEVAPTRRSERHRHRRPSRAPGRILIAFAALCLAAAGVLGVLFVTGSPAVEPLMPQVPVPVDIAAETVAEDAAAEQLVEQQTGGVAPSPVAGQPLRIRIYSVGLDADVRSMSVPKSRAIDPPGPYRAYWLSDYGVAGPGSTNTSYLAGHTFRQGSAVFNPLLNIKASSSRVSRGDTVVVTTPEGDYSYTVESTDLYDKVSVPQQEKLWEQVPGRLVIVTCFQYNGGTSSSQNLVVYAQLDGPTTTDVSVAP